MASRPDDRQFANLFQKCRFMLKTIFYMANVNIHSAGLLTFSRLFMFSFVVSLCFQVLEKFFCFFEL